MSLFIADMDLTAAGVWILGSLPRIRHLHVQTCTNSVGQDEPSYTGVYDLFPVLTELQAYTRNFPWTLRVLLKSISSRQLEMLTITRFAFPSANDLSFLLQLFLTLQRSSFRHAIRVLSVELAKHVPWDMDDSIFSPPLALPALNSLSVHGWAPVIVNDTILAANGSYDSVCTAQERCI